MSKLVSPLQRWILESQQALLNRRPVITAQPAVERRDGAEQAGQFF